MSDQPIDGEVVDGGSTLTPITKPARLIPPRPRKASLESRQVQKAALTTFEQVVGGRETIVDALVTGAVADGIDQARADFILGLLADPKYAKKPLRWFAKAADVTIQELLNLYRAAAVQRAHLASMTHVVRELPAVVQHVMETSRPHEQTCYGCAGVGQTTAEPSDKVPNPSPELCRTCKGSGKLLHQPDLDRQKLALTLGGLLQGQGAGSPVVVNVQQQQANANAGASLIPLTAGDALAQLQRHTDRALYGSGPSTPADAGEDEP
jgi:hypothetical protein